VLVVLYLVMNKKEYMENVLSRKISKPCGGDAEFVDGMCYSKCPEGYVVNPSDSRMCQLKEKTNSSNISKEEYNRIMFNANFLINTYTKEYINQTNVDILRFNLEELEKVYTNITKLYELNQNDKKLLEIIPKLKNIYTLMKNKITVSAQQTRSR
jgi:hypothetical protein